MKSFNRFATSLLIAGLLSLSACVFAGPGYNDRGYNDRGYNDRGYNDRGYNDRGAREAQARGDHDTGRHDNERRGCDSEHEGDGCQAERH
jgi:hypothetical protein